MNSDSNEVKSFLEWAKDSSICLPSPTHYPLQFAYFVRLYRYYSDRKNNDN